MSLKGKLESIGLDPLTRTTPTITLGVSGTANTALATIQLFNSAGEVRETCCNVLVWLATTATGVTAPTAPSSEVVAGTSGTLAGILTTKLVWNFRTNAAGLLHVKILDTAQRTSFVCIQEYSKPGIVVSAQLAAGDYA